jgi:hypothetical protein
MRDRCSSPMPAAVPLPQFPHDVRDDNAFLGVVPPR